MSRNNTSETDPVLTLSGALVDLHGHPQATTINKNRPVKVRIQPEHGWVSLKLRELWQYRELLFFLTWRDIKVRYKQTILGATWAVIQPFMTMVVFSLFFGRLARVPSDGIPYPIFSYAALVPWTFFANGLTQSSQSLVNSSKLITKVYFPRLIIPISTVMAAVIDFCLAFTVLVGMMLYYGINPLSRPLSTSVFIRPTSIELLPLIHVPVYNIIWLPVFLLLAFVTSLGVGLWLSAMNVQFRDVRYLVPFLTQIWMFATPIAYPSSLLPESWRTIYGINPMVGVIEGFRWALLGTQSTPGPVIVVSTLVSLGLLLTGMFYFRRMEKVFADVV